MISVSSAKPLCDVFPAKAASPNGDTPGTLTGRGLWEAGARRGPGGGSARGMVEKGC